MKHGTIEKSDVVSLGDDDNVLRVVYWWKRGDNVLRHTSYFKVEATLPAGMDATKHLAFLISI